MTDGKTARAALQEMITKANDHEILELYHLIKSSGDKPRYTKAQIAELDRRREAHKAGISKSFTWAEVKNRLGGLQ